MDISSIQYEIDATYDAIKADIDAVYDAMHAEMRALRDVFQTHKAELGRLVEERERLTIAYRMQSDRKGMWTSIWKRRLDVNASRQNVAEQEIQAVRGKFKNLKEMFAARVEGMD
jgi:septation ring formation regulator EzrA